MIVYHWTVNVLHCSLMYVYECDVTKTHSCEVFMSLASKHPCILVRKFASYRSVTLLFPFTGYQQRHEERKTECEMNNELLTYRNKTERKSSFLPPTNNNITNNSNYYEITAKK